MTPHSEKRYTGKKSKDSTERRNSYCCKTYHVSGRQRCSRHSINEDALKKTVLDSIKAHAAMITLDEERMMSELRRKLLGDFAADRADSQKELGAMKQTLHNLDLKLEQLYEDKITGVITAETFSALAAKIEAERNVTAEQAARLEQGRAEAKTRLGDVQNWIRLVKENAAVTELDRAMLDALVERVEVGESKVENGVKVQDVRIIYKFVGAI